LFFRSKEGFGMVDWVYKKDGTLIKDYGKEEEKKTTTN
jgi:hypothetical protein